MELPAIIRPAGAGNDDEHADLLIEALLENDLRRDLDPVSRAHGYQRLLDSGRTVKGVAERLQTTQARVREHLRILKLPAELQRKVAVSEIPLRAVKPLTQLESIHPGLAAAAAEQVLNPGDTYEAYTWSDVERAPQDVALAGGELPDGVYRPQTPYPIAAFALSDGAQRDLATVERMLGRPVEQLQFDANDVERARTLGAAHGAGWTAIIVGADVAADLAADYLARGVKELRQRARAERAIARDTGAQPSRAVDGQPADTDAVADAVGSEDQAEEVRRAEREAERARPLRVPRLGHRIDTEEREDQVRLPREARGRAARERVSRRGDQARRHHRKANRSAGDGEIRRSGRGRGLEPQLAIRSRRAARGQPRSTSCWTSSSPRTCPTARSRCSARCSRSAGRSSSSAPQRVARVRRQARGLRGSRIGSAS